MNVTTTVTWLVRYGHVLGAAIWVGGYVVLALPIVPLLARRAGRNGTSALDASHPLPQLAMLLVRVLTYTGTATIGFGVILITRTRGFENVDFGNEWGADHQLDRDRGCAARHG